MAVKLLNKFVILFLLFHLCQGNSCPEFCQCYSSQWECSNFITLLLGLSENSTSILPPEKVILKNLPEYTQADWITVDEKDEHVFLSVQRVEFHDSHITRELYLKLLQVFTSVSVWQSVGNNTFSCDAKLMATVKNWEFPSTNNETIMLRCITYNGVEKDFLSFSNRNSSKIPTAIGNYFECPAMCNCTVDDSSVLEDGFPNVFINCSNANLKYLPIFNLNCFEKDSWLIDMDLSHNQASILYSHIIGTPISIHHCCYCFISLQIQNVSTILDIPAYSNVRFLNLAHNLINSVECFMEMLIPVSCPTYSTNVLPFRMLNLAYNKLISVSITEYW